jgi:hypothetical protein
MPDLLVQGQFLSALTLLQANFACLKSCRLTLDQILTKEEVDSFSKLSGILEEFQPNTSIDETSPEDLKSEDIFHKHIVSRAK